ETTAARQEAAEADAAAYAAGAEMEEGLEASGGVIVEGTEAAMASAGELAGETKVVAEEVGDNIIEATYTITKPAQESYEQAKAKERQEDQLEEESGVDYDY